MIISLSRLHKEIATEYLKNNPSTGKQIEEVVDELVAATNLKVDKGNDKVYLTSLLEEDIVKITPEICELPIELQPYIVCQKYKDGTWSILGCDEYLGFYGKQKKGFIEEAIKAKEAVEDNLIETAMIVVEKGILKNIEGYRKQLEDKVSLIEI